MVDYAPGMRVIIRDEEWIIKKIETNSLGNKALHCIGISPLVKDREAIFLTDLEEIQIVNPAEVNLIPDDSPFYKRTLLYLESQWRQQIPTDSNLHVGHRAAMDLMPYQLDPAKLALKSTRQRILIADTVGLGKTLEAGILMSELIARGKGKRILVVTVKSMMTQFQKEMWNRFTIPLVRLDSSKIQKIRANLPSNYNPFFYYDKTIVSIDTLKRDVEYRTHLENAYWDIIVIDEAQNVAERGDHQAQRSRLAKLLADRSDTMIMLSAMSLPLYVKATRNGRGTRLDRKKRMLVWKVFEAYQNLMKENQIRDINTAMYESTKLLQASGNKPRYTHIIVDEGQDFSDNAYRLLRALAGEDHANDIFIVGDSHQRIYKNHPTLSKCGINVRGRSSILKINYRTTEEIRKYAFALLNGISFDDLDEDIDLGDKCQSLTHGAVPIIKNFKDANEELSFISEEIKKLKDNGVALNDICVVARTKSLLDDYVRQLKSEGINTFVIKRNKNDDRGVMGVRVATMHRVKGLEFKYVFVVAVNNRIVPLPAAINHTDIISEAESITSEKCLLYVSLTRAQKGAYITSYGKKSEFLK